MHNKVAVFRAVLIGGSVGLAKSLAISALILLPGLMLIGLGQPNIAMAWMFTGAFVQVAWTYRKPWRLMWVTCLLPPVAAIVVYLVQLAILDPTGTVVLGLPFPALALGAGVAGLCIGTLSGRTHRLYRQGHAILAQRTVVYLSLWVVSYGVAQFLAMVGRHELSHGGLVAGAFTSATLAAVSITLLHRKTSLRWTGALVTILLLAVASGGLLAPTTSQATSHNPTLFWNDSNTPPECRHLAPGSGAISYCVLGSSNSVAFAGVAGALILIATANLISVANGIANGAARAVEAAANEAVEALEEVVAQNARRPGRAASPGAAQAWTRAAMAVGRWEDRIESFVDKMIEAVIHLVRSAPRPIYDPVNEEWLSVTQDGEYYRGNESYGTRKEAQRYIQQLIQAQKQRDAEAGKWQRDTRRRRHELKARSRAADRAARDQQAHAAQRRRKRDQLVDFIWRHDDDLGRADRIGNTIRNAIDRGADIMRVRRAAVAASFGVDKVRAEADEAAAAVRETAALEVQKAASRFNRIMALGGFAPSVVLAQGMGVAGGTALGRHGLTEAGIKSGLQDAAAVRVDALTMGLAAALRQEWDGPVRPEQADQYLATRILRRWKDNVVQNFDVGAMKQRFHEAWGKGDYGAASDALIDMGDAFQDAKQIAVRVAARVQDKGVADAAADRLSHALDDAGDRPARARDDDDTAAPTAKTPDDAAAKATAEDALRAKPSGDGDAGRRQDVADPTVPAADPTSPSKSRDPATDRKSASDGSGTGETARMTPEERATQADIEYDRAGREVAAKRRARDQVVAKAQADPNDIGKKMDAAQAEGEVVTAQRRLAAAQLAARDAEDARRGPPDSSPDDPAPVTPTPQEQATQAAFERERTLRWQQGFMQHLRDTTDRLGEPVAGGVDGKPPLSTLSTTLSRRGELLTELASLKHQGAAPSAIAPTLRDLDAVNKIALEELHAQATADPNPSPRTIDQLKIVADDIVRNGNSRLAELEAERGAQDQYLDAPAAWRTEHREIVARNGAALSKLLAPQINVLRNPDAPPGLGQLTARDPLRGAGTAIPHTDGDVAEAIRMHVVSKAKDTPYVSWTADKNVAVQDYGGNKLAVADIPWADFERMTGNREIITPTMINSVVEGRYHKDKELLIHNVDHWRIHDESPVVAAVDRWLSPHPDHHGLQFYENPATGERFVRVYRNLSIGDVDGPGIKLSKYQIGRYENATGSGNTLPTP